MTISRMSPSQQWRKARREYPRNIRECRPRVEANPPRARASGLPPERIARATGAWKRDSQSAGTDAPEDASVGPSHGWKNIGC